MLVPDDAARQPALPDVRRPVRAATPCASSCSSRFLSEPRPKGRRGPRRRLGGRRDRDPPAAGRRTCTFKDLGLLVVDEEQRFGVPTRRRSSGWRRCRRADADGEPHPAHARDGAHRDPRPLDVHTPPADRQPILTYVGEYDDGGGQARRCAASSCARARPSSCTTGSRTSTGRPAARRARARGEDRRRARPDGRGQPRARRVRLLGARVRRARVHDDHRVGHRHADGQHAHRRPGGPARARAAPPAPRAGRPRSVSGRTPTSSTRPTASFASRPTSGCGRSASTPSSARASRSPCATSRSAARATCSVATSRATSPRSATTCTSSWSPRRWPRRPGRGGPTPPTVVHSTCRGTRTCRRAT